MLLFPLSATLSSILSNLGMGRNTELVMYPNLINRAEKTTEQLYLHKVV